MFAYKPRIEVTTRILLIATILFNALAISPAPVQAKQEKTINTGKLENRSVREFPAFARPDARNVERNDEPVYTPALISNSASMQSQQFQAYTADGEEGLRLAQDWFGGDSTGVAANWNVIKSSYGYNIQKLLTFYSSQVPANASILHNFQGSISYTVTATDIAYGWVSFQLAGERTAAVFEANGRQHVKFYVDIASPSGSPVTCDSAHTQAFGGSASCTQDTASHVHGMANGGWFAGVDFNSDGYYGSVAVTGLTVGQELIVSFYTPINDLNTLSSCSLDGCITSATSTNGVTLMPINTRTGNYEYYTEDISIPTSAGNLSFTRDYVSATTSLSTTLSPGWTYNHITRLIFPQNPEGLPGKVLFKAHTANKYLFNDNSIFFGDNNVNNVFIYTPEPGLQATLVRNSGTPITYTLTDSGQKTYIFDESGRLLTFADAQGHTWTYTYLGNGKLDQITANGGQFLNLDYDAQGRVFLVKDHTDRSVSYHYNANGDLDIFTDILGQIWTY